jgi:hypothetical protein
MLLVTRVASRTVIDSIYQCVKYLLEFLFILFLSAYLLLCTWAHLAANLVIPRFFARRFLMYLSFNHVIDFLFQLHGFLYLFNAHACCPAQFGYQFGVHLRLLSHRQVPLFQDLVKHFI